MPRATIASLSVYPVKGCRGLSIARAQVAERGLVASNAAGSAGDREWMITDPAGRFVTQREYPRLALLTVDVLRDAIAFAAPGMTPISIAYAALDGAARKVVVWSSEVTAHDAGDDAARWLSTALGADLRLVRFDAAGKRLCNPAYAGDSGAHTAFADGYPVLVIGSASLDELNARLAAKGETALPMNRFRPNIVLSGLDPHDEDHLESIEIGDVELKPVKPCTRCQVTTTDQQTAQLGAEPLATLAEYRMDAKLGGVTFGMNAIVVRGVGRTLAVGDDVDCRFAF